MKYTSLLLTAILILSCKSTSEFTGFSYDPPGVTNTTDREISIQKRRIIGAGTPKVWISNEFESARAVDFYQLNDSTFEVYIEPENYPINNSPWYSFKIWSDQARAIKLQLAYKKGEHRYLPKIYRNMGGLSYSHIIENAEFDSLTGVASFGIYLETEPQQISAHFLDGVRFSDLLNALPRYDSSFIQVDTVGRSHQDRPIIQLTVDEPSEITGKGVLALVSRQHPPEVPGHRAYQYLFETLIGDSDLAKEFRKHFIVKSFPMLNPDGVVNGHWRHNGAGIDLNRDWINFNQPETQAVHDALIHLVNHDTLKLYYAIDFHSTNENIFYPINEEVVTVPDNLTQRWFKKVDEDNPTLNFVSEEFDTSSPISKNWFYHTFGSDALTYEVHDELSLVEIKKLGVTSANSLMQLLIEEWKLINNQ